MAKKYDKGVVPPCPGNPADYVLAIRNGYYYWRRKRGTVKPAHLNATMQLQSDAMRALSPTITNVRQALLPFMKPLPTGSLHNNLFKWLQKPWLQFGCIDYRCMAGKELDEKYTLQKILHAAYFARQHNTVLQINVPVCSYALKKQNTLATEFVLQALLLWGSGDHVHIATETSVLYSIEEGVSSNCLFEFALPSAQPWLAILKVGCFEGSEWARHPKHYGMRVVGAGGDR